MHTFPLPHRCIHVLWCFSCLTAVPAAGQRCGSPRFSTLHWEIRASPVPVWACGDSIWMMWHVTFVRYICFCWCVISLSFSRFSSGVEITVAVETNECDESDVSHWFSLFCSYLHVSRETPASLGARAASTKCLTATPPPAQGTSAHLKCVWKSDVQAR